MIRLHRYSRKSIKIQVFLWYAAGDFTCSAEADSTCAAGRDAGICIPYNIQIGKAFHIGAKPVPTFFFCPGRNRTPSARSPASSPFLPRPAALGPQPAGHPTGAASARHVRQAGEARSLPAARAAESRRRYSVRVSFGWMSSPTSSCPDSWYSRRPSHPKKPFALETEALTVRGAYPCARRASRHRSIVRLVISFPAGRKS